MPFDCTYRQQHGADICLAGCAATTAPADGSAPPAFVLARVERGVDAPPADAHVVDLALLDMHHGWPNLGHDALVHAMQSLVCDLRDDLHARGLSVRVISYDVRRGHAIPDHRGRHEVYVGTGGPGHLDPRRNDGADPGSQGIAEDPRWEPPLFRLFDAIAADPSASLFGVCHTFGVMCRWLGVADAVLRSESKGGKSAGIVDNVLTGEAAAHPWFSRFAARLPDGRHFPVLDSRLYDLVPRGPLGHVMPLAKEALEPGGPEGEALTMIDVVAGATLVPRVLGVNHHPEIVNRYRQLTVLQKKRDRGEVTEEWYAERLQTLAQAVGPGIGDRLLHQTSSYTLLAPLRAHIYRAIARRAEDLGRPLDRPLALVPLLYDPDSSTPLTLE